MAAEKSVRKWAMRKIWTGMMRDTEENEQIWDTILGINICYVLYMNSSDEEEEEKVTSVSGLRHRILCGHRA